MNHTPAVLSQQLDDATLVKEEDDLHVSRLEFLSAYLHGQVV